MQPEPWAAPSGWRSPAISTTALAGAVQEQVDRARAMAAGEHTARRPQREQRAAEGLDLLALLLVRLARTAGEQPRLGQVRREHGGARQDLLHESAVGLRRRAAARPDSATITGSTTTGVPAGSSSSARATAMRDLASCPSIPTLTASTPMSSITARTCASTISGGQRMDRVARPPCSGR